MEQTDLRIFETIKSLAEDLMEQVSEKQVVKEVPIEKVAQTALKFPVHAV